MSPLTRLSRKPGALILQLPCPYAHGIYLHRRTQPALGSRDQNPRTIGIDHITAGPPYTTVNCQLPAPARSNQSIKTHFYSAICRERIRGAGSFSCRRCPHLERPAAPRHVHIISACFPKLSEDASHPAFFSITVVQCLRSYSCHY